MIVKKGDLFTTGAIDIGHGVNVYGQMGAGIALEFKRRFPANFEKYRQACNTMQLIPGKALSHFEDGHYVWNLATQSAPGPNAKYAWVFQSTLQAAQEIIRTGGKRLAIPAIGCGIGGLELYKVTATLDAVETVVGNGFEFEVWLYE